MDTRSQNSLVLQQLQELASNFILDLIRHHPHLSKSLKRDGITLLTRSESEGLSFLTSTLPILGKALLRALETKRFVCPTGFTKLKGTAIPRFMGGLLKEVLEDDGRVRFECDHSCLVDFLQLTFLFYKIDLPYSSKKEQKVIKDFVQTEVELSQLELRDDSILNEASVLVERVLEGFNPREITPRHGPGSVATGERHDQKWDFKRKYAAIHRVYPYYDYFVPSRGSLLRSVRSYRQLEVLESGCARVRLVPKDSRGPRLISMEPLEYQFIQQGIARSLVDHLERRCKLTRKRVNFTDQRINQRLALENSRTREYSTLDMKEASDRVSLALVRKVFARRPDVLKALEATRTTHTELPDGTVIELLKFAPMGSALCFPVEALVFWSLAEVIRRRTCTKGQVYVYGDDIVVPKRITSPLFKIFPIYGLKFNEDKCFTYGFFRESCGMDAYRGTRCTPVRMRKPLPNSRKEVSFLVSGVEFSNHLWERGYWNSANYVKDACEKHLCVDVLRSPRVNFGGLSYVSFTSKGATTENRRVRFNKGLQRHEVSCFQSRDAQKVSKLKGEGRLFQSLIGQVQEKYTVPHTVSLKLRWTPILAWVA